MRETLHANATFSMADGVSKLLSYVWQLQHKGKKGKYETVRPQMNRWQKLDNYAEPTQKIRAEYIVSPDNLKVAMTCEWTPQNKYPFLVWNIGFLLTYLYCLNGCRPREDLKRLRDSEDHEFSPDQGILRIGFKGGKAKQDTGHFRKWSAYARCMCPDAKHQRPPANWRAMIANGQPFVHCTTCPIGAYEVIQSGCPEAADTRIFPLFTGKKYKLHVSKPKKQYQSLSEKRLPQFSIDWLTEQGGNPDGLKYSSNMGRHALGQVCDRVGVIYERSFQLHGNRKSNWKVYQKRLHDPTNWTHREQSEDPYVCCEALDQIHRFFGRGPSQRLDPPVFTNE